MMQAIEHPIEPSVRSDIEARISCIESEYKVRVLYACESGSRGWGFASPDSDYDVRFIYVHPLPWYVQVSPQRDVIELPISDLLDINGWDLRKALGLLKKGNATLIEWLDSPVVYRVDAEFLAAMRTAAVQTHQNGVTTNVIVFSNSADAVQKEHVSKLGVLGLFAKEHLNWSAGRRRVDGAGNPKSRVKQYE